MFIKSSGRVAAGAIAEHYLKKAHGIEIVAFVSSVGKIHLPDSLAPPSLTSLKGGEDEDDVEDALSPEFRKLLSTISREEVDKYPTRCPHQETSEKMTQVKLIPNRVSPFVFSDYFFISHRESSAQKTTKIQLAELSLASSGTSLVVSENPVLTRLKLNWHTPCCRYPPLKRLRSGPASVEPRSQAADITTCSSSETTALSSPQQTGAVVSRAVSPTERTSTSGSASNPLRPSPSHRKPPNTMEPPESSLPEEGTIPASCPVRSPSSRPWLRWSSLINSSSRTHARPPLACFLPSPPYPLQ
jgi:hypothetical protein